MSDSPAARRDRVAQPRDRAFRGLAALAAHVPAAGLRLLSPPPGSPLASAIVTFSVPPPPHRVDTACRRASYNFKNLYGSGFVWSFPFCEHTKNR